jgi:hypothetical protein
MIRIDREVPVNSANILLAAPVIINKVVTGPLLPPDE